MLQHEYPGDLAGVGVQLDPPDQYPRRQLVDEERALSRAHVQHPVAPALETGHSLALPHAVLLGLLRVGVPDIDVGVAQVRHQELLAHRVVGCGRRQHTLRRVGLQHARGLRVEQKQLFGVGGGD